MAKSFDNLTSKINPKARQQFLDAEKAEQVKVSDPVSLPKPTMTLYQDQMDWTRFLSPVKEEKNGTLCRVYWDTRKVRDTSPSSADLMFGGMATMPKGLFVEERVGYKAYVGFLRVK